MTGHHFTRTALLVCILAAFIGTAGAEILECVDETGAVTYTNTPCNIGSDAVQAPGLGSPTTGKAQPSSPTGSFATAEETRTSEWAKKRASNAGRAPDVETIKAARSSLQMEDQALSSSRQREFVALDLRNERWFDFH